MSEVLTLNANQLQRAAYEAAHAYHWDQCSGEERGACGFAWVTVYPEHKGNTRKGKEERQALESLGMYKDWTGKVWRLWSPGQFPTQNVMTLEKGAEAACALMRDAGLNAYVGSRLD